MLAAYYALSGVYTLSASLIWGVNTLFLLDAGLDFFEVFVANAAFSAGMVAFEIPTGVVADTLGRRFSFLASTAVLAATTLLYLALARFGGGVVAFALVSVLMGLGFTFYSGAVEAWLVDALDAAGYAGGLDQVFARGQQVTGGALLAGTVGGGLLGQLDLAVPYVVRAALLVIVFAIAHALMHDIGFTPRHLEVRRLPAAMAATARAGVAHGWAQSPLRLLMLAAAIQTAFVSWAFYAWQPHLLDLLGRDAVWVAGLVSAAIAVSTIAGNQIVAWAARYCGRRTTLMLAAAGLQAVAAVVLGLSRSFWVAFVALLGITGALGVNGPVRQAYLQQHIPSKRRATVTSFDSMVAGVGGTGGQVGLGALGEGRSIPSVPRRRARHDGRPALPRAAPEDGSRGRSLRRHARRCGVGVRRRRAARSRERGARPGARGLGSRIGGHSECSGPVRNRACGRPGKHLPFEVADSDPSAPRRDDRCTSRQCARSSGDRAADF